MELSDAMAVPPAGSIPLHNLASLIKDLGQAGPGPAVFHPDSGAARSPAAPWKKALAQVSEEGRRAVLLMPATAESAISEIAAALISHEARGSQSRGLEQAQALAAGLRLPLTALNLWHLPEKHLLRSSRINARARDIQTRLDHCKAAARRHVERLLNEGRIGAQVIDLEGPGHRALSGFVSQRSGTLTVITRPPRRLFDGADPVRDLHNRSAGPLLLLPWR